MKMAAPRYQDIRGGQVALLSSYDGASLLRVIAGALGGSRGARVDPHADHAGARDRAAGRTAELPWPTEFNALAYVLAGRGTVGAERRPVPRAARGLRLR